MNTTPKPYTAAELAAHNEANFVDALFADAICSDCMRPIGDKPMVLKGDSKAHMICPGVRPDGGHPCAFTDPGYLAICNDPEGDPAGAHTCELDDSHWDAAGLVTIHAETGQPIAPTHPDWLTAPTQAVCHPCVGDILDLNVFCAADGLPHSHMSECTVVRPHACTDCGGFHWTAAAIVAHTIGHAMTAERIKPRESGQQTQQGGYATNFTGQDDSKLVVVDPASPGDIAATFESTDGKAILDVNNWPEVERGIHFAPPEPPATPE